jgi:hypothetical protein
MTTKSTTHVLFVTDMSGSMGDRATDVRGGFNAYVDNLRLAKADKGGRCRLTLNLFDTEFIPLCTDVRLAAVPELTERNYRPRGMTALLDAVGRTVVEFDATTLGADDRVLLVIQTDGAENSSRKFTWDRIRELLAEREATGQWSIVYLGQGVDAWTQGHQFGASTQVVGVAATAVGTQSSYSGLAAATTDYAETGRPRDVGATVAGTAGVNDQA